MLRRSEIAVLACFAGAAALFAFRVPVFEAPDEPFHLDYVDFLLERGALPNQLDEERSVFREGHQPPLYYALAAALVAPIVSGEPVRVELERNPAHVLGGGKRQDVPYYLHAPAGPFPGARDRAAFYALRFLGIALGVANLALLLRVARRFVPPEDAWIAAALAAALPQFLFISASVNNDNLSNLVATAVILAAFRVLERPESLRAALTLGALLGLGLCVKKTSLALVPPVALVFGWRLAAGAPPRAQVLLRGAAALAAMLLVGGWVLVRNQLLYGDPLGSAMERRTLHFIVHDQSILSPYFRGIFWSATAQSFVGILGWMQIRLPSMAYAGWWLLLGVGIAVAAGNAVRDPGRRANLCLAAAFLLANLAGVVYYNTTFPEPQGRFLFPSLAAIAAVATAGLLHIESRLGAAAVPARAALLAALAAGVAIAWLRIDAFY